MYYPKIKTDFNSEANDFSSSCSKVVCVGRNYVEHAKELNNPVPSEPLLFIKSTNTLVDFEDGIVIPKDKGECHHELEIAILIGSKLSCATEKPAINSIAGVGLALDLTLRDVQSKLKAKGQPWEKAKSFDGACPLSTFIEARHFINSFGDLENVNFCMQKNGSVAQQGNSSEMIFPIVKLVSEISQDFTLYPGDIVLTGTPKGVAPLVERDNIELSLNGHLLGSSLVHN